MATIDQQLARVSAAAVTIWISSNPGSRKFRYSRRPERHYLLRSSMTVGQNITCQETRLAIIPGKKPRRPWILNMLTQQAMSFRFHSSPGHRATLGGCPILFEAKERLGRRKGVKEGESEREHVSDGGCWASI